MPPYVLKNKCNGCKGIFEEPQCVKICIGDIMAIDEESGKAYCRSPRDCWDDMACTKACPMKAIEQRIPYQIGYHGAKLIPFMGKDSITWKLVDLEGNEEKFTFKIRNK